MFAFQMRTLYCQGRILVVIRPAQTFPYPPVQTSNVVITIFGRTGSSVEIKYLKKNPKKKAALA